MKILADSNWKKDFRMHAIIVSVILLSSAGWTAGENGGGVGHTIDRPELLPVPVPMTLDTPSKYQNADVEQNWLWESKRRKRDVYTDLQDAASSIGIGGSYIKKFNTLVNGVPPNVRAAFIEQDFSNVTEADIRNLNITVLEFIPPKVISKMNTTYLNPLVERLLQANKPMALGRVMQAMGDKMDSNDLLDKIKNTGGMSDQNEEAASVLLYTALNQVGDKGGLNTAMIRRLANDGLLGLVPEEQLMRVTEPNAAKNLLTRLYSKNAGDPSELDDVDDKALIYKLVETGYGGAEQWSADTIRSVGSKVLAYMPSDFLKQLNPDAISSTISTLKETKFESPLQAKSITDVYLENNGINNQNPAESEASSGINLFGIMANLGPLAAFVNPTVSKESSVLNSIVMACDKLNLPAPLKAVTEMVKQKVTGTGRKIEELGFNDLREMGVSLLKNGPPQLMDQAMKTRALTEDDLNDISNGAAKKTNVQNNQLGTDLFGGTFLKGIIAQVSQYAIQYFTRGGRVNFGGIPAAFLGAIGIKGINDMSNRELDDAVDKLKNNPDALDDAQKALLLKKLRDAGMLDSSDLPPEIRNLQPRKKGEDTSNYDNILDGLPSDAELRLVHGHGKRITAQMLERDKFLVGTLTPSQVNQIDLEEIPAVLAVIRKSKDGPQPQTLEALSKRFAEYVRAKSEDYDSSDKKLLKYITAAEVSKLPATVLAYFIDHRQTKKLPPQVRKEILIAMGELSTKDHATIPGKTRDEIILQGLDALDALTGGSNNKIDVPELAAIGQGVADLPPNRIDKLTPVALETALQVIQGTSDDDDDGLKQRACLGPDQRQAWRNKIVQTYGQPSKWSDATVTSLCCALGIMNEDDLRAMPMDAVATCRCASDAPPPSHLAELKKGLEANCLHELREENKDEEPPKRTLDKVKSDITFDLDDLESQIITRRKRDTDDSSKLTCFKVRLTGSAAHFSKEQLESLNENEMHNCLYELGVEPFPQLENARVLWKKLLSVKSNRLSGEDVRYAGYILSGMTLNDVNDLNLRDPDVVLAFGKPLGLSKNVLGKLATRLENQKAKPVKEFTAEELLVAGNIMCGFSADQLTEINGDEFRHALPVLKNIDASCEPTRMAALAALIVREDVFGSTQEWTAADVRGAGTIINGLTSGEVRSIPPESMLGMAPSVAQSLTPTFLNYLNADQVANIPKFSAQALKDEQIEALPEDAREKLFAVRKGPQASTANRYSQTSLFLSFFSFTAILVNTYRHQCSLP